MIFGALLAHFLELVGTNVAYLGDAVGELKIIGFWIHFWHSGSHGVGAGSARFGSVRPN